MSDRILTDNEVKLLMKPRWADWSREGCEAYDAIRNSHEALGKALSEALAFIGTVADGPCSEHCNFVYPCVWCRARDWQKEHGA